MCDISPPPQYTHDTISPFNKYPHYATAALAAAVVVAAVVVAAEAALGALEALPDIRSILRSAFSSLRA